MFVCIYVWNVKELVIIIGGFLYKIFIFIEIGILYNFFIRCNCFFVVCNFGFLFIVFCGIEMFYIGFFLLEILFVIKLLFMKV